jgi:hypothetical protein
MKGNSVAPREKLPNDLFALVEEIRIGMSAADGGGEEREVDVRLTQVFGPVKPLPERRELVVHLRNRAIPIQPGMQLRIR